MAFTINSTYWTSATWAGTAATGASEVISNSQNVSSVTKSGVGTYNMNFSVNMGTTNYSAFPSCSQGASGSFLTGTGVTNTIRSATAVSIVTTRVVSATSRTILNGNSVMCVTAL